MLEIQEVWKWMIGLKGFVSLRVVPNVEFRDAYKALERILDLFKLLWQYIVTSVRC